MAISKIKGGHLAPYVTFTVIEMVDDATADESNVADLAREALASRVDVTLKGDGIDSDPTLLEEAGISSAIGLAYSTRRPAPWAASTAPWTTEQDQLLLIARRGRLLAVYCSEEHLKTSLMRALAEEATRPRLIHPQVLEDAFCHGETKALWLRGVHRSTTVKPDRKALTGTRLTDALDPVADQTYSYSAASNRVEAEAAPDLIHAVTVSPQEGKVSTGRRAAGEGTYASRASSSP